jgi:hypothetical protein
MRYAFFIMGMLLAACETSVDPFQESGNYFSLGGIVDASADTQFVRISPLRRSAVPPTEIDAQVTSIDVLTGQEDVWQDSLFTLFPSGHAHNFWTTFDFEPGKIYRLTAQSPEGRESRARFALPDAFPAPVVQQTITDPIPTIIVYDVERLADLRILYCGRSEAGVIHRVDGPLIQEVSRFSGGYTVRVDPISLARRLGVGDILWMRIYAAAAGPDWPDFEDIDDETLAHPHTITNVENGVGFIGGVTSMLVDWPNFTPQHADCIELLRRW